MNLCFLSGRFQISDDSILLIFIKHLIVGIT